MLNGRRFLRRQGIFISWAMAIIATMGSLFLSEVMGFIPCTLCWYQRILMYPLALILLIAAIKNDRRISIYVLPFAGIGLSISVYHYLLQKTAFFSNPDGACGLVPCTTEYMNGFGFITIPFLAGITFLIIGLIHVYLWLDQRNQGRAN